MKHTIEIIGLGAGDLHQLPYGVYLQLKEAKQTIYARTLDHPVIAQLQSEGIVFNGFDHIYEKYDHFAAVYENIVEQLLQKSTEVETLIYAVPGHPMLAEKTVQMLLKETSVEVKIIGGQSFLDNMFARLYIDPIEGFQFIDATSFEREELMYGHHIIFSQVYDQYVASEVKLVLLDDLPEDYEVVIIDAVGSDRENVQAVPLMELDRVMDMSNLASVYVPPVPEKLLHHTFPILRKVIRTLRGPNGCSWDQKQTHESLRTYALEEIYELIDAIDKEDDEAIIEELGDVLLQVLLHSQIGEDAGYFAIDDVIKRLTDKMIHRHPHVFDQNNDEEKSWEALKQEEKRDSHERLLLADILHHAPALALANQLQKKASSVGFDWDQAEAIWEKFQEERDEFAEAVAADAADEMEAEFGDMLFVLVNIAQHYQIDPELALYQTNKKFISRFTEVEKLMRTQGFTFEDVTLEKLDEWWNIIKEREK